MNLALITLVTALNTIQAGQPAPAQLETVMVCSQLAASKDAQPALAIASGIFMTAGIKIDWRPALSNCPAAGIKVTLRFNAPADEHPGALAYALPFEGAHLCILYDRIAQQGHALLPHLLGHVIAHEITHMLQGVVRHSPDGLMKAHWSKGDLARMRSENLEFASADIEWLHLGLASREARFQRKAHFLEVAAK